jgi:hypothetical protein
MWVQLFIVLAFALRLVPTLLRFAGEGLRLFLMLSYRLCALALTPIAGFVHRAVGINLLVGAWRVVAVMGLSLTVGLFVIAVTPLVISVLAVIVCLVHGLLVGLIWDEAEHVGHLNLGARLG